MPSPDPDDKPKSYRQAKPSLNDVMAVVSRHFRVSTIDLKSQRRARQVAWGRHCYCLLARELTGLSYHRIAMSIGNRDHSTVIYGVEKARERLDMDTGYAELYRSCARDLGVLL